VSPDEPPSAEPSPPPTPPPRLPGVSRGAILCAVTDRRRLGDFSSIAAAADALVLQARVAADAGLDLFQIRESPIEAPMESLSDSALFDVTSRAREAAEGSAMRVLVNDRLDIALAAGARGVHLRGSSFAAARARTLAGAEAPFLIGRSVHAADEARAVEAAGGLDYLILGAIFPTRSKSADYPLAGVDTLGAAVRACRLPVLAIGGITLENAEAVARAGAAGVAAIGLFLGPGAAGAPGGAASSRSVREIVARLRQIFADARPEA
jgi:thiamine-phosphate diphosphorylase